MLDIINRYIHGYVAIPVIHACYQQGLFDILQDQESLSLNQLSMQLTANEGHLQVALRMFESMKWVKKTEEDYALLLDTHRVHLLHKIPEKIIALYDIPLDLLLKKYQHRKSLLRCLNYLIYDLTEEMTFLHDFLRGAVIVPLLMALKKQSAQTIAKNEPREIFKALPKALHNQILVLFTQLDWAVQHGDYIKLTEAGLFMLERAFNMAVAVSHAPLLAKMKTLLFDNSKTLFKKDTSGNESHIDRTLNVIGSGFQHARYFDNVEEIIVSIFNKQPYEFQPNYIIDTGCGDGTLLKKIYEVILHKTARGQVLNEFPLHCIGVDFNKKALVATAHTLRDIPHYVLEGDVGNPGKILEDLITLGIPDPENALHIRSFLDHDRPYLAPTQSASLAKRAVDCSRGVFVNPQGGLIPAKEVIQSLVEHLARWSAIISKHGLLLLEVHCLSPATVATYFNENESFHFDALQAFTLQYLVEADVFMMAAAEVGLFPRMEFARRYPQIFPYSRITLNYFEKKPYTLHRATQSDLSYLLALEAACWPKQLCVDAQEIIRRIEQFPEGQLVIKIEERIVGVIYTQKIAHPQALTKTPFKDIAKLHDPAGNVLQLISINVAPDMQNKGLGDALIEFILWWVALRGGIEKVVGVTRCKNYREHAHLSMEEYVKQHLANTMGVDPILRFHTGRGANVIAILPHYRPEDSDNQGAGILIEYDILNRRTHVADSSIVTSSPLLTTASDDKITEQVSQIILNLSDEKHRAYFSTKFPLKDMGFDSLQLLEFRTVLNKTFSVALDPTFFFEYNTPAAIIDYLKQHASQPAPVLASTITPAVHDLHEPIAIIGMTCRFPQGINHADAYWKFLCEGQNAITEVPQQRQKSLQQSLTHGGFLADIDCFDADFFHIAPREAELMDPQQRILLEATWEALETAGIAADTLTGTKTGVFVGLFSHDYATLLSKNKKATDLDAYFATGNSASIAAGRLSYFLGLQGPAMTVDTACSSSLVALHLACQSLRSGECQLALAAGINLILSPELNIAFANAGMLSPDGQCKTFDAAANGYVRSEGCGVLVVKTLSQALADQDTVLAVIRGSVINQDGASNGLTAPNKAAQIALLRDALKMANVTTDTISYIETHGTGTSLGDPIEVNAILDVYGEQRSSHQPLIIGAVKSNLGHTEAAAGMAGLIKTILMLQHKKIPGNLHFTHLNPHVQASADFLKIPTTLMDWAAATPLRAGVSSFGFSGTNAHVLLEEAPLSLDNSEPERSAYLITLSAKTEQALQDRIQQLATWLATQIAPSLDRISYTLNIGRCHFAKRVAMIVKNSAELQQTLQLLIQHQPAEHIFQSVSINAATAYTGDHVQLAEIAQSYVQGQEINWPHVQASTNKHRISLPTYPFTKQRYWYDSYAATAPAVSSQKIPRIDAREKNHLVTLHIQSDGVALVSMVDTVGKNQFSFALLQALEDKFAELTNHPDVKVVVITGYDDIFCLGGAEEVLLAITKGEVTYTDLPFLYRGLLDCTLPVISAVQGHAFGAGLAFGLYADVVVMAEEALYTANFMKYGFTPGVGSTLILKEKLSEALASEMMWTAKEYTGHELKSRGASVIFKQNRDVVAEALAIAKTLARKPRYTLMTFKREMSANLLARLSPTIECELRMHSEIFANSSATENIESYFNKLTQFHEESNQPVAQACAPQTPILQSVLNVVANKLHLPIDKVDSQRSFRELGVDSISAVEIVRELSQLFHYTIEAAMIYDHPTVQQLAAFLSKELHQTVEAPTTVAPIVPTPLPAAKTSLALKPLASKTHQSIELSTPKKIQLTTTAAPSVETKPAMTDIAIIGFSGRFPGADDANAFWGNLMAGQSTVTEVPLNRWSMTSFYDADPEKANSSYSKWGGFLNQINLFDPLFFGLSPAEAEQMDPQQRLFLEESWKVFEEAGYPADLLAGKKCAVFVGACASDYGQQIKSSGIDMSAQQLTGMNCSILSARISYHLDLKGPSVTVDTACSSSLVALHQACQSIWMGESEMALAGGVFIASTPEMHIMTSKAGMLSPEGRCKTFDDAADGFVPGEAIGIVLLKPLAQALQDNDIIYAVIKGSGVNQDGKTNGITAPSAKSQTELLLDIYKRFHIDPATINYVEAHGTGTKLGDPIEVGALTRAFRQSTDEKQFCAIGSVKTNIGHTLLAAGIASVIKVLLCLKHRQLVPSLNYQQANQHIQFADSPFYVNTLCKPWEKRANLPRRAAISSFGLSGTNAHMVIEEAPEQTPITHPTINKPYYLVTLSAKTENALNQRKLDLATWLTKHKTVSLASVSYTLNARRTHFAWRSVYVVATIDELITMLSSTSQLTNKLELTVPESDAVSLESLASSLGNTAEYKNKLLALGDLYLKGQNIPWHVLHANEAQQRVVLPTYPFAKEQYWLSAVPQQTSVAMPVMDVTATLLEKTNQQVMQVVADLLKIKLDQLDVHQELSQYGMDSIQAITFINTLNKRYGLHLTPAILFEHATFASFTQYLVTHHAADLELSETTPELSDVAVIGMSGIFPGAANLTQFWENLKNNYDSIQEIPKDRWDWQAYDGDPFLEPGKTRVKWGGFIEDMAHFDAEFFNISAREAALIDPQQRLFLQAAWHAIEDAGYAPDALAQSKTGVFVGVVSHDYAELLQQQGITDPLSLTGNTRTFIANRVSYLLNLTGPSEVIDTACSSSLVAIHHAVRAIQQGDCHQAIAGGVNVLLTPRAYLSASKAGMLSKDGRCKTFDKDANGYVRAEGVGVIFLKSLAQAQKDRDPIYAIIKGTAVNHGGRVSSLTVPNPNAQAEVILAACQRANVSPSQINYVEMHGTGTSLGDPIEINGLKKAFAAATETHSCGLGSVKTQIGHLESAAGIASVIKVLLAMRAGMIPGNLHCTELNPYIEIQNSPFYIAHQTQNWPRLANHPRLAGVSAFGFGGVNAHVILEEVASPVAMTASLTKPYYLMTLSAKDANSLVQKIKDLRQWLMAHSEKINLAKLSFTLNTGRTHFKTRCACVVNSLEEFMTTLQVLEQGQQSDHCVQGTVPANPTQSALFVEAYQAAMRELAPAAPAVYREKLLILADLYIKNYPLDWFLLYNDEEKQRLSSLPTYPFKKQRHWFTAQPTAVIEKPEIKTVSTDLTAFTLTYLQAVFAEKLQVDPQQIAVDVTYEVYGIESIMGLEITKRLEEDFGDLPKTLLYERNQLTDLAHYLQKKYPAVLHKLSASPEEVALPAQEITKDVPVLSSSLQEEDIAIVGLSGTYPMAKDLHEFWNNLEKGVDCISAVPPERWNYKDYPVNVGGEEKYFNHGGFLPDVDKFDPLFFNISPSEATLLDPQERLFLQCAWATLEDAGYTRTSLKRSVNNNVGVFVGVTYNFYPLFIAEEWQKGNRLPLDVQLFSIANRVSYSCNLNGPSYIIDTACSSSLAAIHAAYESIQRGECKMAIAGGVNLSLHPSKYHMLGSYSFMSDTGRCTSFGANGQGYVPGEGVGAVLLKPLSLAIQEGDHIYGVIKSSSMNHGGKTSGYTVPNPIAQAELIKTALRKANIHPRTISYIEAHGTGTALGDPIEIRGLQEAFEDYTSDKQFCAIGSVKSNIGHLESAAGISQLTKVLLQLRYKKLAPSLHATELNPYIDFAQTPFFVQRELSEWQTPSNQPRRAGISSFGAGGTNVHIIVDEYAVAAPAIIKKPFVLLLSAKNIDRLQDYLQNVYAFLKIEKPTDSELTQICYTSQTGREHHTARIAIVATSYAELLERFQAYLEQKQNIPGLWINEAATTQAAEQPPADMEKLAEQWVMGVDVVWENMYEGQKPQRASFPTYPFAKRRCWVTPLAAPVVDSTDWMDEWLYTTNWLPQPLRTTASTQPQHWLVFTDLAFREHLEAALGQAAATYCYVGEQFEKIDEHTFQINPTRAEDYQCLLKQVHAEKNHQLTGIIYLSSCLPPTLDASQQLLAFFHALLQQTWHHTLQLCLVTRASQAVGTPTTLAIWQHHLWSMVRIWGAERGDYRTLLLDLDVRVDGRQDAQRIIQEMQHYRVEENHIAYRDQTRFSLQFATYSQAQLKEHWQAPKTALVTGGLGALGTEVTQWLVQQGTTHLLLTGTTIANQEKNDFMQALKNKGIQVTYAAVDVTNKQAMQAIVQRTTSEWQLPIQGVFHLAGITTDNVTIENMSADLLKQVLSVKIQGALVLHELFSEATLNCFVLFSSISALPYFGIGGLSAYAMANEFLNGLAVMRRGRGLPATSINWVAWAEKGMSFKYNHSQFLAAIGMATLPIAQGMQLLTHILTLQPTTIAVCKIQWQTFLRVNPDARQLNFFMPFFQTNSPQPVEHLINFNEVQINEICQQALATILQLELSEIEGDTPYQNYGLDSILGVNFIGQLNQAFADLLTPMDLYRYPTLNQLVAYVVKQRGLMVQEPEKLTPSFSLTESQFFAELEGLADDQIERLIENELT